MKIAFRCRCAGQQFALDIVIRRGDGIFLECHFFYEFVQRVQLIIQGEVIRGYAAINRIPQNGNVSRGPAQTAMQTKRHMTLENLHVVESSLRPAFEFLIRPKEEARIDAEDTQRIILPLDDPVEGSASTFGEMHENDDVVFGRKGFVKCAPCNR